MHLFHVISVLDPLSGDLRSFLAAGFTHSGDWRKELYDYGDLFPLFSFQNAIHIGLVHPVPVMSRLLGEAES